MTDTEARAAALAILLGAAETSGEIKTLIRVGRRAGFLWACPTCRTDNYADREVCCGRPRPAGDA